MQTIAADREHRGAERGENGEYAGMAQSLRHSKRVEGWQFGLRDEFAQDCLLQRGV